MRLSSGGANGEGPGFPDAVGWRHARVPITYMRSIQNVHEVVSELLMRGTTIEI